MTVLQLALKSTEALRVRSHLKNGFQINGRGQAYFSNDNMVPWGRILPHLTMVFVALTCTVLKAITVKNRDAPAVGRDKVFGLEFVQSDGDTFSPCAN